MARTMADRLSESRRRSFVGREPELRIFDTLVSERAGQAAVLFLHGPAGIGKSTLIRMFLTRSAELGLNSLHIDARDIPPTVDALAFRMSGLLADAVPSTGRSVVLIDGYELLMHLDAVLREQLAPQLPGDVVLVIAGQHPPSTSWRSDPGWASLLHVRKLGNLSRAESGAYLSGRGVPAALQSSAIEFTHGHPLALALIGEVVRQKGSLAPADSADVVHVLMERILEGVPSRAHRATLEAAAQVRALDEPLLAVLLDLPDAAELFSWMRRLSFVDTGMGGLYLHDLARDVLAADLRWRHMQRFVELHARARQHYLNKLQTGDPTVQASAILDLIYLHPDLRQFLRAPDDGAMLRVDQLTGADTESIAAMIELHEGVDSAQLARRWISEQPNGWLVVRDRAGMPVGCVCLLTLNDVTPQDTDPAVLAAVLELRNHPPLRPSETATLIRFWLSRDSYQSVSPVQSLIATQLARHYLTTTGLAVSLLPFAYPEEWETFCSYADLRRAPDADFAVGERRYTTFSHDWRLVPPAAWVAQLSLQEVGGTTPMPAETSRVLVLAEADFSAAVRKGLRDFTRPDRLRSNPLLRCRLVSSRLTGTEPIADQVAILQSLIKTAADSLGNAPADRRLHRVLVRAYLSPAPSLERAAEVLELPSSTFRRLLTTAIIRVTTVLWHQELDG